jgi:hypothetical protein
MPFMATKISIDKVGFVEEVRNRLSLVSLEYYETIRSAPGRGRTSGRAYHALLPGCAAKSEAQIIYIWTARQFHSQIDCIAYLA